jgi:DNA-binding transcriptional LysR family regulator
MLGAFQETLETWLRTERLFPKAQRRPARRLFGGLQAEGYRGAYDSVQRFVRRWKATKSGAGLRHAFVPLAFSPGEACQFGWSHEHVELAGVMQTIKVAHFWLTFSRQMFVVAYPRGMRSGSVLTVGVAPAFALHWLIPRFADFNRIYPEVEVRMATGGLMNPLRDDWTCTVRRGMGDWPSYTAEKLFPATLVPVCTPTVAASLQHPRDLRDATLIVVSHLREQWTFWFEAAGLRAPVQSAAEASFESSAMAMQAVLDGVGVAVAQLPYVSDALVAGRLVAPFRIPVRRQEAWYLGYRPIRQDDPALLVFRDWLHGEAERQRQACEEWA